MILDYLDGDQLDSIEKKNWWFYSDFGRFKIEFKKKQNNFPYLDTSKEINNQKNDQKKKKT